MGISRQETNQPGIAAGIALLPGSRTSCILITVLTVMLAAFSNHPNIDPVLRTLYFAALYTAFHAIRHREPALNTAAYRLLEMGFLVLTLGFAASAVIRLTGLEDQSRTFLLLSQTFQKGAVYLLGVSLITYGILLFLPSVVESYRIMRERVVQAEDSNKVLESHMIDADRYRALGELAAGIAHDLRNPLTIVKTAAESLARKERKPEEVAEYSKVIARNVERAERTIAALLDLGKPATLSPRASNLPDVLAELVTLVKPEARRRTVEITHSGPAELIVYTDQKLLSQAVLNLLLNALQASGPESKVFLKTRVFALGGREMAAVIVEDRGSGLRASDRDELFSPFFTTKEEGTGLGLLSCRRILSDLGGDINLYPRQRGGARAVILLPMERLEVMA